jgi:hypothetical protein
MTSNSTNQELKRSTKRFKNEEKPGPRKCHKPNVNTSWTKKQKHPAENLQYKLKVWQFTPVLERGRHGTHVQKGKGQEKGIKLSYHKSHKLRGNNTRLVWHLEEKHLLSSKQADFQQHRLLMENQIIYTTQEID